MTVLLSLLRAASTVFWLVVLLSLIQPERLNGLAPLLQQIALLVVVVHLLEIPLFIKRIRAFPGSMPMSLTLTLLFGLFHFMRYPAE